MAAQQSVSTEYHHNCDKGGKAASYIINEICFGLHGTDGNQRPPNKHCISR